MIARNILIVVAVLLFIFNALPYLMGTAVAHPPEDNEVNRIAYWIGFNIFFILGIIILLIALLVHKRIHRKRRTKMLDSLLN